MGYVLARWPPWSTPAFCARMPDGPEARRTDWQRTPGPGPRSPPPPPRQSARAVHAHVQTLVDQKLHAPVAAWVGSSDRSATGCSSDTAREIIAARESEPESTARL